MRAAPALPVTVLPIGLRMTELHDTNGFTLRPYRELDLRYNVTFKTWKRPVAGRSEGAMSDSAHEALVRQAIELIWNRGDLDAADELFATAYVNHYGLIVDVVLGPEAVKISAALYRLAFPGLHVSVEEISTVEDTVVLRWTARIAADRLRGGAVASHTKSLTGITRSRIAAGKIIESWTEWDRIGVLRELGVPTE